MVVLISQGWAITLEQPGVPDALWTQICPLDQWRFTDSHCWSCYPLGKPVRAQSSQIAGDAKPQGRSCPGVNWEEDNQKRALEFAMPSLLPLQVRLTCFGKPLQKLCTNTLGSPPVTDSEKGEHGRGQQRYFLSYEPWRAHCWLPVRHKGQIQKSTKCK